MRHKADMIRRQGIERAIELMGEVDPATRERLQTLWRSIANQPLREPTVRLERTVHEERGDAYVSIRSLFAL